MDLDFDDNLAMEAKDFAIGDLHLGGVPQTTAVDTVEAAVMLAMGVYAEDFVFYTWCEEWLSGDRSAALADIPTVRSVLKHARESRGPNYYRNKNAEAWAKYNAVRAAQAAVSAVQWPGGGPWLRKVVYYASLAIGE